jgi:hypothetical protein
MEQQVAGACQLRPGARRREEVEEEIEMAALAWAGASRVSGFSPMRKRERGEESGAISLNQSRGVVNTVDFASRRGQTGRTRAADLGRARPCRVSVPRLRPVHDVDEVELGVLT